MSRAWIGVDVGGKRKGFDVAVIDESRLVDLRRRLDVTAVAGLVEEHRPEVVAIDSPCCFAAPGRRTRESELELNREVCGIRWTPDEEMAQGPYYEWVHEGLALHRALEGSSKSEVIEVFPTASWTRWLGPRGQLSRSRWTSKGVQALALEGIPAKTNQDQRDAIAAAVTARECSAGGTEALGGEIVVPKVPPDGRTYLSR